MEESRLKAILMASTTYCTRFDNKDKTPGLFPFLQPYEAECRDAEYIYNNRKRYGKEKVTGRARSLAASGNQGH